MRSPWWRSSPGRSPSRISSAALCVGSRTITGRKRRSSAASFSIYLRYSSSVVAPIICSSLRPSAGFRRFAASIAPSALPAPTIVCISSTNKMTFPQRRISTKMSRMRSSNSPRYFVPATTLAMSSAYRRLPRSTSGTAPAASRWAKPSTMAVLPTPGSPMSAGLFLFLRLRICISAPISASRPITGSARSAFSSIFSQ